ncbi:bifunctional glutamate N-acetyltransferase/amino-acid acetyltransferase ArgJ [Algisphaera agarilytica]|uniref:Arginine biosynthesis bifunctional protein ArgJ n=1 Tax=Algisphaera agarilytica TaxID=1385975 RepID=A0A7X0HB17_9BACT|nr:bifunctional glutamate N-acetyltransferase/amino-acid acetyltransferase ArgJ [Algisphaera agarilytica]MBB6431110.1 glutamate N-acetyltransferase/amino-acid N-acetyltransferase [Algisphaera agarilytica]
MDRTSPTSITRPIGFRAAGSTCGIKPSGKPDLALIVSDTPCTAAGVFTTNKVKGAPVLVSQKHVRNGKARAIVCNSGTSNVATGEQGLRDAEAMCQTTAAALGLRYPSEVLVASTGVIGHRLPMDKVLPGIEQLAPTLAQGKKADNAAADAILTTDLVRKTALRTVTLGGKTITLGGICKGSGMIAPNMATMLAFITTDVAIDSKPLKLALRAATSETFNRLSVDSDKSTSDSVMVLANGQAKNRAITGPGRVFDRFVETLTDLCRDLSEQLIWDGEGVTRIMRVRVSGAASVKDADRVGRSVVDSPLVKTALHGADPNWGRIAMAAGKSDAKLKKDTLSIRIAGMSIYEHGQPTKLGLKPPAKLAKAMAAKEVQIEVDLGLGKASAEWLGCDLTREYIHINADYTT